MSLVADSTRADANSFATVSEADAYFGNRLNVAKWTQSTNDVKEKALMWASAILSRSYEWKGRKTLAGQYLAFPRIGVIAHSTLLGKTTIPVELKDATYELALALLETTSHKLAQTTSSSQLVKDLKVGSIALTFENKEGTRIDVADAEITFPLSISQLVAPYTLYKKNPASGSVPVRRV